MNGEPGERLRDARTFHPRRGRMTDAQRVERDRLAERFGAVAPGTVPVVEVGFGMGEATVELASADRSRPYVAVDVHTPGVLRLMRALDERGLDHVSVLETDALEWLDERADGSVAGLLVFFPDPWPKARHHHRRLFVPVNVDLFARVLAPGSVIHLATDDAGYADDAVAHLVADGRFDVTRSAQRPTWRPVTRFENRAIAAGRAVHDIEARRRA